MMSFLHEDEESSRRTLRSTGILTRGVDLLCRTLINLRLLRCALTTENEDVLQESSNSVISQT